MYRGRCVGISINKADLPVCMSVLVFFDREVMFSSCNSNNTDNFREYVLAWRLREGGLMKLHESGNVSW